MVRTPGEFKNARKIKDHEKWISIFFKSTDSNTNYLYRNENYPIFPLKVTIFWLKNKLFGILGIFQH